MSQSNMTHTIPLYLVKQIEQVVKNYRQRPQPHILKSFACQKRYSKLLERNHDKNFLKRGMLVLWLSEYFTAEDKPLIRWLIKEYHKSSIFWVDMRDEMALLGYMLYKYMSNQDLPYLYLSKFCGCSDTAYSVDIEIVLGFGETQTIDYLTKNGKPSNQQERDIIEVIKAYRDNRDTPFRTYDEYLALFEQYRLTQRQESLAESLGLIEPSD